MTENLGYPTYLIYLALAIGGVLAVFRPRAAVYAAALAFVAVNSHRAPFTRTELLGPYFNLFDSLLVVMLLATIVTLVRERRRPYFPRPLLLVLAVVVIGTFTSAFRTSLAYDILREVRWAYNFPIVFFVFANMIETEEQARPLFICLLAGSLLAATQHVTQVNSQSVVYLDEFGSLDPFVVASSTRTIAFVSAGAFFLAAAPHMSIPFRRLPARVVYLGGLALMAGSMLLNQTRSVWIALALTFLALGLLLRSLSRSIVLLVPVALLTLALFAYTFAWLDPVGLVADRFSVLNEQIGGETEGRLLQLRIESDAWLRGNPLFGNGIGFVHDAAFRATVGPLYDFVAWGHVGHLAYLSRLGLLGLFVYSLYLPLWGLRRGLAVRAKSADAWTRVLVTVGLAAVLFGWFVAFMSSSYLDPGAAVAAIFYGALAGLDRAVFAQSQDAVVQAPAWAAVRPARARALAAPKTQQR